jgi:hypothetical protein
MDAVMERHQTVRDLVANGWVMLHSLSPDGRIIRRCVSPRVWESA